LKIDSTLESETFQIVCPIVKIQSLDKDHLAVLICASNMPDGNL